MRNIHHKGRTWPRCGLRRSNRHARDATGSLRGIKKSSAIRQRVSVCLPPESRFGLVMVSDWQSVHPSPSAGLSLDGHSKAGRSERPTVAQDGPVHCVFYAFEVVGCPCPRPAASALPALFRDCLRSILLQITLLVRSSDQSNPMRAAAKDRLSVTYTLSCYPVVGLRRRLAARLPFPELCP